VIDQVNNSKTPPIRVIADRRGRNREEAGMNGTDVPAGRSGSQELYFQQKYKLIGEIGMSIGSAFFFDYLGRTADTEAAPA
jgi:hypothetical protein